MAKYKLKGLQHNFPMIVGQIIHFVPLFFSVLSVLEAETQFLVLISYIFRMFRILQGAAYVFERLSEATVRPVLMFILFFKNY